MAKEEDRGDENKPKKSKSRRNRRRSHGKSTEAPASKEAVNPTDDTGAQVAGKENDVAWYARDPQLLLDAARIPFSTPLGTARKFSHAVQTCTPESVIQSKVSGITFSPKYLKVPGICTLWTKPSFGVAQDRNSPANVAATALYTMVRYINSGRKNYDPADLFLYCLTISDLYSFTLWMQKLYAASFMYSQRNQYVGKAVLRSNGIANPDTFVQDLANFRYYINVFINKISSYAVPADITLLARRAFMYSGLYLENPDGNIKDQLYQFAPDGFYAYALDCHDKGCLEFNSLPIGSLDLAKIMAFGDGLLANIWGDEDFGLISGDIVKAYNGKLIGLQSQPDEAALMTVFDQNVLNQIKNASVVPVVTGDASHRAVIADPNDTIHYYNAGDNPNQYNVYGDVYQLANGNLQCREAMLVSASDTAQTTAIRYVTAMYLAGSGIVLTVPDADPSPEVVVEATRLTAVSDGSIDGRGICSGSDIVTKVEFTCYKDDGSLFFPGLRTTVQNADAKFWDTNSYSNGIGGFMLSRMFKYCPTLMATHLTISGTTVTVDDFNVASEVDNFTLVSATVLQRLHEVALLSLLYVPGVAKIVNF